MIKHKQILSDSHCLAVILPLVYILNDPLGILPALAEESPLLDSHSHFREPPLDGIEIVVDEADKLLRLVQPVYALCHKQLTYDAQIKVVEYPLIRCFLYLTIRRKGFKPRKDKVSVESLVLHALIKDFHELIVCDGLGSSDLPEAALRPFAYESGDLVHKKLIQIYGRNLVYGINVKSAHTVHILYNSVFLVHLRLKLFLLFLGKLLRSHNSVPFGIHILHMLTKLLLSKLQSHSKPERRRDEYG